MLVVTLIVLLVCVWNMLFLLLLCVCVCVVLLLVVVVLALDVCCDLGMCITALFRCVCCLFASILVFGGARSVRVLGICIIAFPRFGCRINNWCVQCIAILSLANTLGKSIIILFTGVFNDALICCMRLACVFIES